MKYSVVGKAVLAMAGLLGACVSPATQLAPVSPEAVAAEEIAQRELVVTELSKAQQRLDNLSFPLLVAATPLCKEHSSPRIGVSFRTVREFKDEWGTAAASALGLSDTLTLTSVPIGSPAAQAGLRPGDHVVAVNGVPVPTGKDAVTTAVAVLRNNDSTPLHITIQRGPDLFETMVKPIMTCDFATLVVVEGDINAFADGERVIVPWAMMRFANDDELVGVVGHEIAHNAMGHIAARQKNALWGGLFGALIDVAAATQGVNTQGQNTANFMAAAAQAFSQDFEREADYVGMYILARAGRDLTTVPNLWRQFAQINPAAISYSSTHPTTAERFVRLRTTIEEINRKREAGQDLLPEMKKADH